MFEPRTILVPTDLTEHSLQALDYGWEFARSLGAEMVLVHACAAEADLPAARDRLEELKGTLAPLCRRYELAVSAPVDFVVTVAGWEEQPLVVMATHGRRGALRRVLGSTAEGVVSRAPCPVLTVKPPGHGFLEEVGPEQAPTPEAPILDLGQRPKTTVDLYFADEDRKLVDAARRRAREREEAVRGKQRHALGLRRILAPVDFSDRSRQALDLAAALARVHGAEVVLLHVLEEGLRGPGGWRREAQRQEVATVLLGRLAETLAPLPSRVVVATGRADQVIVEQAGEADLVVLATRGRRRRAGIPLGSTAGRVVRRAPCPVLTVRAPEGEAAALAEAAAPMASVPG